MFAESVSLFQNPDIQNQQFCNTLQPYRKCLRIGYPTFLCLMKPLQLILTFIALSLAGHCSQKLRLRYII
jgi:hypothetical protein